jgi:hypothetical protein
MRSSWDFDTGRGESFPHLEIHRYSGSGRAVAGPGDYTVSATAIDAEGNVERGGPEIQVIIV